MCIKNKTKTIGQKTHNLKHVVVESAMRFTPIRTLVKNRRAVSAVMSNLILIGAVVAIGLVALGYTRATSINYQTQYAEDMSSDIGKLKENISFEYVHYDGSLNILHVYFLNCGTLDVEIDRLSVNTSTQSFSTYHLNGTSIPNNIIAHGQEGHIESSMNLPSGTYSVKLTTGSESVFAYDFLV